MIPRRTCPACSRRYAGLVSPDCPVCQGLGTLSLGAAALHHYEAAPVARAIELYLEGVSRRVRTELDLGQHRAALEAAVDDLRLAGVLASPSDTGTPARTPGPTDAASARVAELNAYRLTREALGIPADVPIVAGLAAPPAADLADVRPRDGRPPTGSANGHRSALATIADPIDPLGPDTATVTATRYAEGHRANVIAHAVPHAARRRATP